MSLREEPEVVVLDVGVDPFLALPIHDADVHLAVMEIDSAIEFGAGGVIVHTLLVTWCLRHRVIGVVLRGVLVTLPAHRPMLAKTNQGFHGSIKSVEPTGGSRSVQCVFECQGRLPPVAHAWR